MRYRFVGVLLLALTVRLAAEAQVPFTCTANVATPPLVRSEGLTELTADFILSCGGTAPMTGITATVALFLNTNITSKLIGATSEVLLLIDEPAAGAQTLGVNVFQGVLSANQVTFTAIPIVAAPGGTVTRVLRITNIRANANAIGAGNQLVAFVSLTSVTTVPVNNPQQIVAFIETSTATSLDQSCLVPGSAVPVRFAELFATAFKPQGGTGQSTPGTIYNTESGFTPDPIIAGVGTASSGTQLGFTLTGIAPGVQLSVPATLTAGTLTIDAVNPPGGGPVPIVAGTATIIYEVTAADAAAIEEITIPVTVSAETPGALVNANLYPISTVGTASATEPIPRFVDVSTPEPFAAVLCNAVPVLGRGPLIALAAIGLLIARRRLSR